MKIPPHVLDFNLRVRLPTISVGFNPERFPILSQHWPGLSKVSGSTVAISPEMEAPEPAA